MFYSDCYDDDDYFYCYSDDADFDDYDDFDDDYDDDWDAESDDYDYEFCPDPWSNPEFASLEDAPF